MKPNSKLVQLIKRGALVGAVPAAVYAAFCVFVGLGQRNLLYFPTHHAADPAMLPWTVNGETIGFHRSVPSPQTIWLMMHGNGGQASDRTYALPRMAPTDALDDFSVCTTRSSVFESPFAAALSIASSERRASCKYRSSNSRP